MLYSHLTHESARYRCNKEMYRHLQALRGGAVALLQDLSTYLPRKSSETSEQYAERQKLFSFTPVLQQHIEELADRLLASPLSVEVDGAWYPNWTKDTDGLNTPEAGFLRELVLTLLWYRKAYIGIYLPSDTRESLADEANDKPEVKIYTPAHVIREGVRGRNPWYVTREVLELASPESSDQYERTILWQPGSTQIYDIPLTELANIKPSDPVSPLPYQNYPGVPVAMVVIDGKAIGEHGYLKQLQHTRIENSWTYNAVLTGQIQRIYKPQVLPEDDPRKVYATPDYSTYDFSGTDVLVGGGFEFVEAKGDALGNLQGAMDKVEQQLKALVHKTFATGSKGALEQSGLSKSIDQIALNDALKAFGVVFVQGYHRLLQRMDVLMGGDDAVSVSGMQDYSTDSLDELLDKTDRLLGLADLLSPVAMQTWLERLQAAMHPGISQELLDEMRDTIPEWADDDAEGDVDVEALATALGLTVEEVTSILGGQGG